MRGPIVREALGESVKLLYMTGLEEEKIEEALQIYSPEPWEIDQAMEEAANSETPPDWERSYRNTLLLYAAAWGAHEEGHQFQDFTPEGCLFLVELLESRPILNIPFHDHEMTNWMEGFRMHANLGVFPTEETKDVIWWDVLSAFWLNKDAPNSMELFRKVLKEQTKKTCGAFRDSPSFRTRMFKRMEARQGVPAHMSGIWAGEPIDE